MAWDGSGSFSRTNGVQNGSTTWANADDAGHDITTLQHDVHDQDMAAGIAACMTKDGQSKATADLRPNADASLALGSAALRWLTAFVGSLKVQTGSFTATVSATTLTANRLIELPDAAGTLAISGEAAFAVGTRLIFQQTSAPSGWTKQTSSVYNDAAIRLTTGTVSTGGADAFTTHFGTSKTSASTTLSTSQMPVHTHGITIDQNVPLGASSNPATGNGTNPQPLTSTSAGGGGSHNHTLSNFNIKYADAIVCAKA